jgi:hypothetical protein
MQIDMQIPLKAFGGIVYSGLQHLFLWGDLCFFFDNNKTFIEDLVTHFILKKIPKTRIISTFEQF